MAEPAHALLFPALRIKAVAEPPAEAGSHAHSVVASEAAPAAGLRPLVARPVSVRIHEKRSPAGTPAVADAVPVGVRTVRASELLHLLVSNASGWVVAWKGLDNYDGVSAL